MEEVYEINLRADGKKEVGNKTWETLEMVYNFVTLSNNEKLLRSIYEQYLFDMSKEIIKKLGPLDGGKVIKSLELKVVLEK